RARRWLGRLPPWTRRPGVEFPSGRAGEIALGRHDVAGEVSDRRSRHLADRDDAAAVAEARMHVDGAALRARFAAARAGNRLDVDRHAGESVAVEQLHRIAEATATAQGESGRRRRDAPARVGGDAIDLQAL